MAMISCSNCGGQISEKATQCVHCGVMIKRDNNKICKECGFELEENATVCSGCGCPVDTENNDCSNSNFSENAELKKAKGKKKVKIIIALIAVILIVGSVTAVGIVQYQIKIEDNVKKYGDNLELAADAMLLGASESETCANLIKKVWYNTIFKESDYETDKYTKPDGYFVSDFNESLGNLYWDSDFVNKISDIKENKETVNSFMKKLKNPPEEYEEAYDALKELYDSYLSLTNLATDPSGSLQTYSSDFAEADKETLNCYNAVKIYFED